MYFDEFSTSDKIVFYNCDIIRPRQYISSKRIIHILRQQKDWVGGFKKCNFLLTLVHIYADIVQSFASFLSSGFTTALLIYKAPLCSRLVGQKRSKNVLT